MRSGGELDHWRVNCRIHTDWDIFVMRTHADSFILKHDCCARSMLGRVYGAGLQDEPRRGLGCAVRPAAAADWDCCSVNKTVRGCSAAVCGWKHYDTVSALVHLSALNRARLHHEPTVGFSTTSVLQKRGWPGFLLLIKAGHLSACTSATSEQMFTLPFD